MRLDICPQYKKMTDNKISHTTVIVVDVLRSSTSIIRAVQNGADKVIPAADPGEAVAIYSRLNSPDCILAGEVNSVKHPDFHIGNSPSEFSANTVKGKTIIISTSNGTAAIHGVKSASRVLIGAMSNASAVAAKAASLGNDILIVCAGTNGNISADDLCAAGAIATMLMGIKKVEETDMSFVCRALYRDWKSGALDLSVTEHWSKLKKMGLENDIKFCFSKDTTDVVPEYVNGIILKA